MTMRHHRYGLVLLVALSIVVAGGAGLLTPSHHITEEYNAAFAAAENGDLAAIQSAVTMDPTLLKATEWDHQTLLHDAVRQKHADVVRYLLAKQINVNAVTDDGLTALHMAAQNGDIPMLTLLLERGATLNPLDSKGWTPLDRAKKWGHIDAATFLRSRGASGR
jgi:ankyrin repeat protein